MSQQKKKRLTAREVLQLLASQMLKARLAADIDQAEAGARAGIPGTYTKRRARWGSYERSERTPPLDVIRNLPDAFPSRPLTWFFGLEDERGLSPRQQVIIKKLQNLTDPAWQENTLDAVERVIDAQLALWQRVHPQ